MRLGRCWSLLLALHVQTGGRTTGTSGIGKDMQQFKNKCCEIEREVFFYKKNRFWGMYYAGRFEHAWRQKCSLRGYCPPGIKLVTSKSEESMHLNESHCSTV